jgi:hypothetical protein
VDKIQVQPLVLVDQEAVGQEVLLLMGQQGQLTLAEVEVEVVMMAQAISVAVVMVEQE